MYLILLGVGVEIPVSSLPVHTVHTATMSSRQQIDSVIDDDDEFWYAMIPRYVIIGDF